MDGNSPRSYAPRLATALVHPIALRKAGYDTLICFSHLRWDFVFQRPQHLMTRFGRAKRVIFWEEPTASGDASASLDVKTCEKSGVVVVTPPGSSVVLPEPSPGTVVESPGSVVGDGSTGSSAPTGPAITATPSNAAANTTAPARRAPRSDLDAARVGRAARTRPVGPPVAIGRVRRSAPPRRWVRTSAMDLSTTGRPAPPGQTRRTARESTRPRVAGNGR